MASNRRQRTIRARAERRASKARNMANPGGESRYALKKAGEIRPDYRLEGGYLLDPVYMRHLHMPGPYVITIVEHAA
jgi:hypothetical protein